MSDWKENLGRWMHLGGKDRAVRWWLALGFVGIGLIALSEWVPGCHSTTSAVADQTVTAGQVEQAMEQRITDLLSQVDGVGRCRVMVTLEQDAQAVYAADTTFSGSAGGESYLTVDTDTGPVGLLITRIQPTVKGVVVVCDGAADPQVSQWVSDVVTTAFHISQRRVCVARQK